MKAVLVVVLTICLQAATAPLCLCHGPADEPSCCHAPVEQQQDSCPHCDLAERFAAEMPGKVVLAPDSPETLLLDPCLQEVDTQSSPDPRKSGPDALPRRAPPPAWRDLRLQFQVFLI